MLKTIEKSDVTVCDGTFGLVLPVLPIVLLLNTQLKLAPNPLHCMRRERSLALAILPSVAECHVTYHQQIQHQPYKLEVLVKSR